MTVSGPDVAVPRELDDFRRYVRAWLASRPVPEPIGDLAARFPRLRQWQRELYDAGLVGISWPREWGGQGLSVGHQLVLADELARVGAPQAVGQIGLDVVGPSIAQHASPELRSELLQPLLTGEHIWCQGFSESEAGSDLASLRTLAVRDGDEFVIDGQKIWTSFAQFATHCAVLARTDSDARPAHRGISYFVVAMDAPGITVRPVQQITGEEEFCEVFFDAVRVSERHLIGDLHDGWRIAMDTLSHERGSYALRRQIEISGSFEDAMRSMRSSLASSPRPVPETTLAEIGRASVALRALRGQTWATLGRMAEHQEPSAEDSIDKVVLAESEQAITGVLRELVGPYGAISDGRTHGIAAGAAVRDYLYGRAASVYGGTGQIQRNIIGERHLGLPRR